MRTVKKKRSEVEIGEKRGTTGKDAKRDKVRYLDGEAERIVRDKLDCNPETTLASGKFIRTSTVLILACCFSLYITNKFLS